MSISPSEYGGYSQEIQPEPHQLTSAERLRLAYRSDPDDPDSNPDDARTQYQEVDVAAFEEGSGAV